MEQAQQAVRNSTVCMWLLLLLVLLVVVVLGLLLRVQAYSAGRLAPSNSRAGSSRALLQQQLKQGQRLKRQLRRQTGLSRGVGAALLSQQQPGPGQQLSCRRS